MKEVFLFIVCVLHTARARLKRYGSSRDILVLHPSHGLEPSPDVTIPIANRFLKNVLQGAFSGFSSTSLAKKLVDLGFFPSQETHKPLTFSDKLELPCTTIFPAKGPVIHRKREYFRFQNFPPPSNQAEYVAWCGGSSSNVNFAKKKKEPRLRKKKRIPNRKWMGNLLGCRSWFTSTVSVQDNLQREGKWVKMRYELWGGWRRMDLGAVGRRWAVFFVLWWSRGCKSRDWTILHTKERPADDRCQTISIKQ